MLWVQRIIATAVLVYVCISAYRFATMRAATVGDAFTPVWVQRLLGRRELRRMREEHRRRSAPDDRTN